MTSDVIVQVLIGLQCCIVAYVAQQLSQVSRASQAVLFHVKEIRKELNGKWKQ